MLYTVIGLRTAEKGVEGDGGKYMPMFNVLVCVMSERLPSK